MLALSIANIIHSHAFSQSLGVNTTGAAAANSAILDVSSTDKGMLIPRMSKTERNAITAPATGLMVFQNAPDSTGFYYYDGTAWLWLATNKGGTGWLTTGNVGTTIANNFFGTTDNIPLSFRQNNNWIGRWNSTTNNYFIGDSSGYNSTSVNNIAIGSKALFKNTNSYGNIAIGSSTLQNNTTSLRNTAIGDSAMFTQSFNGGLYLSDNTAIGSKALYANQPTNTSNGVKNTAIGSEAMFFNTTGTENTAIGVSALRENTTGGGNTAIGRSAHRFSKTGSINTYIGYLTGYSDSAGLANTAIGASALYNHQTGSNNVAVGLNSLWGDSIGRFNTAIGANTSYNSDTAEQTVAIGYSALFQNNRDFNVGVGAYAGYSNSVGSGNLSQGIENTMVGYAAFNGNALGSQNTAIGFKAMAIFEPGTWSGTAPSRNVAVGDSAAHMNRGNDNVAIGYRALSKGNAANIGLHVAVGSRALLNTIATYPNTAVGYSSQDSATTGYANTSMGSYSLMSNKTGINNTAIGNAAMMQAFNPSNASYPFDNTAIGNDALRLTRYYGHVAVGSGALRNDTSGTYNTAVGYLSMNKNLSGAGNTALGNQALSNSETSGYNTAVGSNSLLNHNHAGWTYNTAVGASSLEQDVNGFQNTGIGVSAFRNNIDGFFNTGVGINAGYWQKESYNTFVGAYAGAGERSPGNNFAADTGQSNVAVGAYALYRLANGNDNVAIGKNALNEDSSGIQNVAIGSGSLDNITSGNQNTGIGVNTDAGSPTINNATGIGANAYIVQSNSMVLGSIAGTNGASSSVNVGIGTNTPGTRLHVRRNGISGGLFHANASVIIEDNTQSYVQLSNPNNSENGFLSGNAATIIRSAVIFGVDSSILFRAGGNTTRMAVDNTGFIGIGTTGPLTKLHILETTASNVNLRIASASSGFEPGLELVKTGVGTDWKIRTAASGTLIYARSGDDFAASTIDEYEMSTTSFRPFTDGTNSLGLSGNRWTTVYATVGAINTSDARDKENIADLNYGLNEVMKLRPVSFNWKENPQWGRKIGFIAQEVKPILGEVVQTGDLKGKSQLKDDDSNASKNSDKLGIYYSDIIPVAVKAIQEQQLLIERQAKENAALKEKNAQLEKDIQMIKEKLGIKN